MRYLGCKVAVDILWFGLVFGAVMDMTTLQEGDVDMDR